jgi:hypothetical protein
MVYKPLNDACGTECGRQRPTLNVHQTFPLECINKRHTYVYYSPSMRSYNLESSPSSFSPPSSQTLHSFSAFTMTFFFLFLLPLAAISPTAASAVNSTCWDRNNNATVLLGIGGRSNASEANQNLVQPLTFLGSLVKSDNSSCFTLRGAPQLHQLPSNFTNDEYNCSYFADLLRPWPEDYKPWVGSVEVTGARSNCCAFYEGEECKEPAKRSIVGGTGPVAALYVDPTDVTIESVG